ncbi:OLC1v1022707C1 [Oldenlandia corymbosa var. corymbosa]|uniref:OLC1v1022707C1 n=1 Tax=Oldenlandia corymbosa var. corymbosa TaxID=529605 RepID=A0AAV1C251_OLDCO|nr:OLC1v1022707C1 [Oldenlandia corymbosa var. corymbosa]
MPTVYPSQVLLQTQPKRAQPIAKHRRANVPTAGIGGRRKTPQDPIDASMFQTLSPMEQAATEQDTMEQAENIDVEVEVNLEQGSLPLAKTKKQRTRKPPKRYTPSRSTPPPSSTD